MIRISVPGKRPFQVLKGVVKQSQSRNLRFCRSLGGRKLFAFLLPVLLLIGGKWLGTYPVNDIAKYITSRITLPEKPEISSLLNVLELTGLLRQSNSTKLTFQPVGRIPVERYGLLELDLEIDLSVVNPYDPKEIELMVRFTAPSGTQRDVGVFWYQGYDPQTRQPTGEPGWKVRFTPDEPGEWSAVAFAPTQDVHSAPIEFEVIPSERQGFVHTNPDNPSYLAYENGDLFFPIGVNMAWWGGCCDPLQQYRKWLDQFSANGGNTIRVWMAAWSFGIEWKDTGLGNYDSRQYEAWLLDQLFRMAEEHHVKIILVLMNHGPFSLVANSEWKNNPYNSKFGGPLTSPEQFVSDPIARSYYQQRLSYIIYRWGYSPSLLAWEWWNEVDLTPITERALIPWLKQMTAYLRQRDVNHHLTTNSFSIHSGSSVWKLPELDFIQVHEYSEQYAPGDRDPTIRVGQELLALKRNLPSKPILLGEFGYSARDVGEDVEKTGIQLHNGLWATTFSGYAGSGMYWWWDIYIEANNLWSQYNGLSDFISGVDLTQYKPFSPRRIANSGGVSGQVIGLGLRGKDTIIWLRSKDYTVDASITARGAQKNSMIYVPPLVEGQFLTLNDTANGMYTTYWYDPQTATWLQKAEIAAVSNSLTIPIPAFRTDLAVKIVRNP